MPLTEPHKILLQKANTLHKKIKQPLFPPHAQGRVAHLEK